MEFYRETPRFCEGRRRKLLKKAFLEARAARVMNFVSILSSGQGSIVVHLAEYGFHFDFYRQILIWPAHSSAGYNQALKLKGAKTCV
jgi:hypothetical protein